MQSVNKTATGTLVCLLITALVALFIAVAYVNWLEPREHGASASSTGIAGRTLIGDEGQYLGIAKNIASGNGYSLTSGIPTAVRVPGYPYYLAFLFKIFGMSVSVALLGNALLIMLLPLLTFALAKPAFSTKAATFAALFCTLNPGIYFLGVSQAYAEPLFAVMLCTGTALWLRARQPRHSCSLALMRTAVVIRLLRDRGAQLSLRLIVFSVLAGCLYGVASLTRTGYIALPIAIVLAELVLRSGKVLVMAGSLLLLSSALVVCPWAVRNRVLLGKTVIGSTNDGCTLLGTVLAAEQERGDWLDPADVSPHFARLRHMDDGIARDQALTRAALKELKDVPPFVMLEAICKRVLRLWVPLNRIVDDGVSQKANWAVNIIYFPMMSLALFGVLKSRLAVIVPLLVPCLYATLLAAVSWGGTRFRYGLEPIIACFAGYGLAEVSRLAGWFRGNGQSN
jgi:4-amino-4-deoxy-L-arabinose transferase-like glycosyltransferase